MLIADNSTVIIVREAIGGTAVTAQPDKGAPRPSKRSNIATADVVVNANVVEQASRVTDNQAISAVCPSFLLPPMLQRIVQPNHVLAVLNHVMDYAAYPDRYRTCCVEQQPAVGVLSKSGKRSAGKRQLADRTCLCAFPRLAVAIAQAMVCAGDSVLVPTAPSGSVEPASPSAADCDVVQVESFDFQPADSEPSSVQSSQGLQFVPRWFMRRREALYKGLISQSADHPVSSATVTKQTTAEVRTTICVLYRLCWGLT